MTKSKRNYHRLYTTLPAFLTGAVLAYKYRHHLRKPAQAPPNPPSIEWISADSTQDSTEAPPAYLTPQFDVGDTVVTVNPFTYDYAIVDLDGMTPLYYEIKAVALSPSEGTVRYLLDGEDDWYAEEWLDFAPYPDMCAELTELTPIGVGEGAIKMTDVSKLFDEDGEVKSDITTQLNPRELATLNEEFAEFERKGNIDRLLDVMNGDKSTEEEKAEAKRALKELISGEGLK